MSEYLLVGLPSTYAPVRLSSGYRQCASDGVQVPRFIKHAQAHQLSATSRPCWACPMGSGTAEPPCEVRPGRA